MKIKIRRVKNKIKGEKPVRRWRKIPRNIIVAGWKMNPDTIGEAKKLFLATLRVVRKSKHEIIVIPPAIYISELKRIRQSKIKLGVQNIFWQAHGAFTGEISAAMAKSAGAIYVMIGHSERRRFFCEGDFAVRKKIASALSAGLTPIVFVGTASVVSEAEEAIRDLNKNQIAKIIFAYEPVWAIGTGHAESALHAAATITALKKKVPQLAHNKILYGGSIDPDNARDFISNPQIDGILVGHESLNPKHFEKIVKSK